MSTGSEFEQNAVQFGEAFRRLHDEISKVIVGHRTLVEEVLSGLFAGGHVLLEGVPGIGKTMLVSTLANALDCHFARIQFTPDLMPSDIIGTRVVVEDERGQKHFSFQKGPVFTQILLADEINRATPKTQSALLEAMQEKSVTVAGQKMQLPPPFFVLGTQNPLEMEGTYPLPEAQLDRFLFKLVVTFPTLEDLIEVSRRTTRRDLPHAGKVLRGDEVVRHMGTVRDVPIAPHVESYAARLLLATHPGTTQETPKVKQYVKYGASPRGLQALVLGAKVRALLDGRFNVSLEDLQQVAKPALRHRLILNFEGEAEEVKTDDIISEILERTPADVR
ncbi:MAG: MoxR family ATPase [Verrucomicrobia bacterium]|nr:MoxR family ATPase [Verrucomicrobiota bacterium]